MAARNKYTELKKAMTASPKMWLQRKGYTAYITNGAMMLRIPYSYYESNFIGRGTDFPALPAGITLSRSRKGDALLDCGIDCEQAWNSFPETSREDLYPLERTGFICRATHNEVEILLCRDSLRTFAAWYTDIAADLGIELLTSPDNEKAPAYGYSAYGELLLLPVINTTTKEHLRMLAKHFAK